MDYKDQELYSFYIKEVIGHYEDLMNNEPTFN